MKNNENNKNRKEKNHKNDNRNISFIRNNYNKISIFSYKTASNSRYFNRKC